MPLRILLKDIFYDKMFQIQLFYRVPNIRKTGSGLIDKIVSDKRSLKNLPVAELGDDQDGNAVFFSDKHYRRDLQ